MEIDNLSTTKKTMRKITPSDVVKYFTNHIQPVLWEKNKIEFKAVFKLQLKVLKLYIEEGQLTNEKEVWLKMMRSFVYRLSIGYFGVGKQAGLYSGVFTIATTKKGAKSTNDHLFGAVAIGERIHEEFIKNNFDIGYMVEEWLPLNLYLWLTIKITNEEHQKECVIRDGNTIEEKMNLIHYQNVSQLMAKKV